MANINSRRRMGDNDISDMVPQRRAARTARALLSRTALSAGRRRGEALCVSENNGE